MSEHTHNTKSPVIIRNEIPLELTKDAFGKKSKENAGKVFFTPVATLENWETFVKWVGLDEIISSTNRTLRRISADIFLQWNEADYLKEDGTFNWNGWAEAMADFTAGRTTLSDLEEQIDNLQALQESYTIENPQFGETDAQGNLTPEAENLMAKVKEGNKKISALRAQRKAIQERYEAIAAKRAAASTNSPTKTA